MWPAVTGRSFLGLFSTPLFRTLLVAHARKETVNGEAVSGPTLRGPRVGLLVGIPVRHALTGDGLYELVGAHI